MVPNYDKQDAVFHDLIVRTLARNPMGIEEAIHCLEFNFREVLKSVTIELENKVAELREIKQAIYPFLSGYEIICPSCWLGFETQAGLSMHTRANKCLLHRYPKHTALLHWVFQTARSGLKMPLPLEKVFQEEIAASNRTQFTAAEAMSSYSRMCMAVGLVSFFITGSQRNGETWKDLRETFTTIIKSLTEDRQMEDADFQELVEKVMKEYIALNVSPNYTRSSFFILLPV